MQPIVVNIKIMKIAIDKAVIQKVERKQTSKGKAFVKIRFTDVIPKRDKSGEYTGGFYNGTFWNVNGTEQFQPGTVLQIVEAFGTTKTYMNSKGENQKSFDITVIQFNVVGFDASLVFQNNYNQQPQQAPQNPPQQFQPQQVPQHPPQPQTGYQGQTQTYPTAPTTNVQGGYINNIPQAPSVGNYGG